MPDYTQGKIYKIVKKDDHTQCYVGSTTLTLSTRLSGHKCKAKQEPHRILYEKINNKWDEWDMILIENYPCNSKKELEIREGELIKEFGILNQLVAGRTFKEYYEENKQKFFERMKPHSQNWKEKNKDRISEYNKQYKLKIKAQQNGLLNEENLSVCANS